MTIEITYDDAFGERLEIQSDYYDGWQVTLTEKGAVELRTSRQNETFGDEWHNRAWSLLGVPGRAADLSQVREWIEDREEDLQKVIRGYTCTWDGSNHKGCLDDSATSALFDVQMGLEEFCRDPTVTPCYWYPGMFFDAEPPEPGRRNAETLVADALEEGHYLDADEVEQYLTELAVEEADLLEDT
jgi:hypothetical protein